MDDKFTAEHSGVGGNFRLVLVPGTLGMEGVCGGVKADEAFARSNGAQQLLLAFSRHWRSIRLSRLGEVSAGVEGDSIILVEVSVKDLAIFGADHIEAVAFTKFGEDSVGNTGLAVFELDGVVFITCRACEVEDLLLFLLGGGGPVQRESRSRQYRGAGCPEAIATTQAALVALYIADCLG